MNFLLLSSIAALLAGTEAKLPLVGQPSTAVGTLSDAYLINCAIGIDCVSLVQTHFAQFPTVDYNIRTSINNKFASFVSVNVPGRHSVNTHIESIAGADSYSYIRTRSAPKPFTVSSTPLLTNETIHSITGVNDARKYLGATGKGVKVAVIDTGVYYLHPALGGCFGPGCKVAFGYDLVGDNYGAANSTTVPDSDPLDNCTTESHGTHVAGIIAGDTIGITGEFKPAFDFTGVAPEVTIGAYRIFGCPGDNTGTDVITAAIYMAAEDGADVINLSLGGGPSFPEDPDQMASAIVGRQGHIVSWSNGNDGGSGAFSASPSSPGSFGIASFDNVQAIGPTVYVDDLPYQSDRGVNNGNFDDNQVLEIVVNNIDADAEDIQNDGCTGTPTVNATGKALLIRWGSTTYGGSVKRCTFAVNAGAIACILYSNTGAPVSISGSAVIPSVMISHAGGLAILDDVKAGKTPKVVVSQQRNAFAMDTAGTVSDYSSLGLSPELLLKPDVGGIGGMVYSTISPHANAAQDIGENYGTYSGTSMASPYVCGVLALLIQKKGPLSFDAARGFIQNNAKPAVVYNSSLINSPVAQGAGLVNAYYSIAAETLVLPSSFSFNDTVHISNSYSLTILNNQTTDTVYEISVSNAATINPYNHGDDFTLDSTTTTFTDDNHASFTFSTTKVAVSAGSSQVVTFSVVPPTPQYSDLYPIYGGFIKVVDTQSEDELNSISIPFAGVAGDWNEKPVWSTNSPSLLARYAPSQQIPYAATGVYDANNFFPVGLNNSIDVSSGAYILVAPAATSRWAEILVTYMGNDDAMNVTGFTSNTALINNYAPLQRVSYAADQSIQAPSILQWAGDAYDLQTEEHFFLPLGPYKVQFIALKPLGGGSLVPLRRDSASNYQTLETAVFNLVNSTAAITTTTAGSSSGATAVTTGGSSASPGTVSGTTAVATATTGPVSTATNAFTTTASVDTVAPTTSKIVVTTVPYGYFPPAATTGYSVVTTKGYGPAAEIVSTTSVNVLNSGCGKAAVAAGLAMVGLFMI
ncbi:hypothetical protein HDU82_000101 [Entophlyctis luteolus]|nr:hypothetical protein HDU82_000101 [Entophlyctis luteolus]